MVGAKVMGLEVGFDVMGLRVGVLEGDVDSVEVGRSVGGNWISYVGIAVGEKVGRLVNKEEAI